MADSKIPKNKIPELLNAIVADYELYAPKAQNGIVAFARVVSTEDVVLNCRNTTISPKELFLPRAEVVYELDGQNFVEEIPHTEKQVIFGMRPCDCRALALLDLIFDTEQIKDPFYITRRQNTIIIALACNRPLSSCFCTAVGGDPFGQDGADVLMADVDNSLLTKPITPKGKDFLAHYSKFFSTDGSNNWDEQAKQARDKINSNGFGKLTTRLLDVQSTKSCLDERFEDNIWESISQKCLGCGVCSYLCPTCYCFDLVDEKTYAGARKVRTWDCCMFSLFTLHASGHNPRPVNAQRLRQKIMHKFSYYPEQYGVQGCVGCGRCIRSCPVNLDIGELLKEITSAPGSKK